MARFRYKVKDRSGQVFEGTLDAADRHAAAAAIHAQDYFILDLHQDAEPYQPPPARAGEIEPGRDVRAAFRRGLGPRVLGNFFRSLAQLLHAGMDVRAAGESLSNTARRARLRQIAHDISEAASRGDSMSSVLDRNADAFPPIVLGMIKAGEQSGNLEGAAADLADYFESQHGFHIALWGAIFYPLLVVSAGVLLGPIAPSIGRGLVYYLISVLRLALPFLVLFGTVALLMFLQARNWPLAESVDRLYVSLPWIGSIERRRSLGRWAQAFAMLWEAGMSQAEALELSASAAANRAIVHAVWRLVPGAREGRPLSQLLASTPAVPAELAHIVVTGEQSGALGDALRKVSESYGMESEAGRRKFVVFAYVALYALAAIFVAVIVIGAYVGTYQNILNAIGGP
jgi:type II secretory pathway component PulF